MTFRLSSLRLFFAADKSDTFLSLQRKGVFSSSPPDIIMAQLDDIITNHDLDADTHYCAALAMDTLLPRWMALTNEFEYRLSHNVQPIFESSLPDYLYCIHDVMFSPEPVVATNRHHIICKVFPRAGMSRRFIEIVHKQRATDGELRMDLTHIMMCGLLGNYKHCANATRADLNMRMRLYGALYPRLHGGATRSPHPKCDAYLRELLALKKLQRLPLFILREYVVSLIDGSEVTRKHANNLFAYEAFRAEVLDVMGKVRVYLRENLTHETGTLSESHLGSLAAADACTNTLKTLLATAYSKVVKNAYRKPRRYPLAQLRSAKGERPPTLAWAHRLGVRYWFCSIVSSDEKCSATRAVSRRKKKKKKDEEKQAEYYTEEDIKERQEAADDEKRKKQDEENESHIQKEFDLLDLLSELPSTDAVSPSQSRGVDEEEEDQEDPIIDESMQIDKARVDDEQPMDTVAITRDCIRVDHSTILYDFVARFSPDTDGALVFSRLLEFLPFIGACRVGLEKHRLLAAGDAAGIFTRLHWIAQLTNLRHAHPYTYNLLQASAIAWTRHTDIRRYDLPYHYVMGQMRAIAHRNDIVVSPVTGLPRILPLQSCTMAFCRVCMTIYSIVRGKETVRKLSKKKRHRKTDHTHGYPQACVDTVRSRLYCTRGRAMAHEKCNAQPLAEINILGKEILFKDVIYIVCPQPGCGQIATLDIAHTSYSIHGIACRQCSKELMNSDYNEGGDDGVEKERKQKKEKEATAVRNALRNIKCVVRRAEAATTTTTESKAMVVAGAAAAAAAMVEVDEPRCYLCWKRLTVSSRIHLYGVHIQVCDQHNMASLCHHVVTGLQLRGLSTTITTTDHEKERLTEDLLLEYHRRYEADQAEQRKKRMKTSRALAERNALIRSRMSR